jgi:hypothetical protein
MAADQQEDLAGLVKQLLDEVKTIKADNTRLTTQLDSINGKVNILSSVKQINESAETCKFSYVCVFVHNVYAFSRAHVLRFVSVFANMVSQR